MVRLKAERLQRGWTLVDLSFHSRVGVGDLSRIECGRLTRPYPSQITRLAAVLNVDGAKLLEDVNEPSAAMKAPA